MRAVFAEGRGRGGGFPIRRVAHRKIYNRDTRKDMSPWAARKKKNASELYFTFVCAHATHIYTRDLHINIKPAALSSKLNGKSFLFSTILAVWCDVGICFFFSRCEKYVQCIFIFFFVSWQTCVAQIKSWSIKWKVHII